MKTLTKVDIDLETMSVKPAGMRQINSVIVKKARNHAKKVDKFIYDNIPAILKKLPFWLQRITFRLIFKLTNQRKDNKIIYKIYVFGKCKGELTLHDF